ncbi:hypothetical protein SteCoe_18911 [Stentor coeruleus]|uniref:Uncharacterized protein n=1 Tax=Stentor coeruleus TaxID=5963 RepID=A0A1R2BVB9_9CILI|nr:hypothetical protein SteCoe_18911 [Stentor coeruleus]
MDPILINGELKSASLESTWRTLKTSFTNTSKDCDVERSHSRLSQTSSTQNFSLKDIIPDENFKIPKKHQRISSQNPDVLAPQFLFAYRKGKIPSLQKKSIFQNPKSAELKKSISMLENEEFNSIRSFTSQSRRMSDNESTRSHISLPKINIIPPSGQVYCKHCDKQVETSIAFPEDGDLEGKLAEFVYYFLACWEPTWTTKYKTIVCEDCGRAI